MSTKHQDSPKEAVNKLKNLILKAEPTKLYQIILVTGTIPQNGKRSITIPIFKKRDQVNTASRKRITFLSTAMKLFTSILKRIIEENIQICEKKKGLETTAPQ